ncbi:MAG: hypothetical protein KF709_02570 [Gemmatimonadaceae bacterium]|nr:hypothetical protein [Gemmatimonadaceae bacterium]
MARPTRGTLASLATNGGATTPHLLSVTCSGANRGLLTFVQFRKTGTEEVTAISRDGQTPTLFATNGSFDGSGWATRVYRLDNANAGAADLSVALNANRNTIIIAIPYSDLDLAGTPWGTPVRESDMSTEYGASVTADQELVSIVGALLTASTTQSFSATGAGHTLLANVHASFQDQYAAAGYQHELGAVTASWSFTTTPDGASNWLVAANGIASGPSPAAKRRYRRLHLLTAA